MTFCDVDSWNMTLTLDKAPGILERFRFALQPNGTGQVLLPDLSIMSALTWSCESFGTSGAQNEKVLLSFVFRFRRMTQQGSKELGVLMAGFAHHVSGHPKPEFRGRLRTFAVDNNVPAAGTATLQTLDADDPGDTGTGTGQQT